MKVAQSTGDAGVTAFRVFLTLVSMGEVTGLLLKELAWADAASPRRGIYSRCYGNSTYIHLGRKSLQAVSTPPRG